VKRAGHKDDLTMRYMQRFSCIGEKCEDNCCHTWTVQIDAPTLKRMKQVTSLHSEKERKFWQSSLHMVQMEKDAPPVTAMKMREDGRCPMLQDNGLCHVQGTFGENLLSDTCAVYPRRIQKVGEALELSGMMSCPEMSRQLLLHADACDIVPLDRHSIFRIIVSHGADPRDIRPYWRLLLEVRSFMLGLLRRPGFSLEQRLFFMTWFAKRASPILNKSAVKADTKAVMAEMTKLESDEMLRQIAARFDASTGESAVTLVLARELVRCREAKRRSSFGKLVEKIFQEYQSVRAYVEGDLESPEADSHAARLHAEYRKRRARVTAKEQARIEQYLTNIAHNYWMHRLPLEAPDLMVHMLRLLALMAVLKFLVFSHPTVQSDGDDLQTRLDAAMVEVLYTTARYIEHGPLLGDMENALERVQLRSLAGAIYLIRF
jgi:lysine-N-methylase